MDLRERKRGLRSTSWDDGREKPVESCLALHEMDLKPFSRNCGQVPPKRARRSINGPVRAGEAGMLFAEKFTDSFPNQ